MEALAAAAILREQAPDLKLRFVNVVDLFKLQQSTLHPHGCTDREFGLPGRNPLPFDNERMNVLDESIGSVATFV